MRAQAVPAIDATAECIALRRPKQVEWRYYPDGLLQRRFDSQGQPVTYLYDANNQLQSSRDASGLTT